MNVFRLVLCLAGLTAYLVVKQWLHSSPNPSTIENSSPSTAPRLPVSHQAHKDSCPDAKAPTEVVKVGHAVEDGK
jgi:hypothetical protein